MNDKTDERNSEKVVVVVCLSLYKRLNSRRRRLGNDEQGAGESSAERCVTLFLRSAPALFVPCIQVEIYVL